MLEVLDATVRFGTFLALDDVSVRVETGQIVAILGPSGSGKTTLLRAVAGLQPLDRGTVLWDGEDLADVPPHRRGFGLVFQDLALFPHLDVGRNVEFGLRMQGVPTAERRARAAAALARVELGGMERRPVATLSGGQAQRVALARALAPEPRLILFDEPLGSLDRTMRERLITELRGLLAGLEVTALYVTHDQQEAFGLADRVVVFDHGRVRQAGTPQQVWASPADEGVARFLGLDNVLEAVVEAGSARTAAGAFAVPDGTPAGPVRLLVRPAAIMVDPTGAVAAVVRARTFRGADYAVELEAGGVRLEAIMAAAPVPGEQVRLHIDPQGVTVLEAPAR